MGQTEGGNLGVTVEEGSEGEAGFGFQDCMVKKPAQPSDSQGRTLVAKLASSGRWPPSGPWSLVINSRIYSLHRDLTRDDPLACDSQTELFQGTGDRCPTQTIHKSEWKSLACVSGSAQSMRYRHPWIQEPAPGYGDLFCSLFLPRR